MSWWEAALLGLLQGLTEFLPVSSSGHLVLGRYALGLEPSGDATFAVFVHFGTVLSILTVYRHRVRSIAASVLGAAVGRPAASAAPDARLGLYILLSLVPTAIVYLLLKDSLEAAFGSPRLVCLMLIATGALLFLTLLRPHPNGELSIGKALAVGAAQAVAIIPGISRSGATICAALYQNVSPEKAADFSFLMLLPVVVGATILKSLELQLDTDVMPLVVGTLAAYVSGVVAIRVVLKFVRRGRLHVFAWYCLAAGTAGLFVVPA